MPVYQPAISKLCRFTGLNRKPPTIRNSEILKQQVNGLLYFEKADMVCLCQSGPVNRHSFEMVLRQY